MSREQMKALEDMLIDLQFEEELRAMLNEDAEAYRDVIDDLQLCNEW